MRSVPSVCKVQGWNSFMVTINAVNVSLLWLIAVMEKVGDSLGGSAHVCTLMRVRTLFFKKSLRSRAGRPQWPLHALCVFSGRPLFDPDENPRSKLLLGKNQS